MSRHAAEKQWTLEQLSAIESRGQNLLVSAAAGSGKTAVLVERIFRLITDTERPVDVDRLLVVTFTEASAGEMKRRIGEAISRALANNPGDLRLRRQALYLGRASISTLHAFCSKVLRRFFYLLDLDPAFRVMDALEAHVARQDVLNKLIDKQLLGQQPDRMLQLLDRFGGTSYLHAALLPLYDFARSQPDPVAWLRQAQAGNERLWAEQIADTAEMWICSARNLLNAALDILNSPDGPASYEQCVRNDIDLVNRASLLLSQIGQHASLQDAWDSARDVLSSKFERLPAARRCCEHKRQRAKRYRDAAKDAFSRAMKALGGRRWHDILDDLRRTSDEASQIASLLIRFDHEYSGWKRASGLLDFFDLEHLCLEALRRPDVRALMREQYDHVMVDECQDISPVQEAIIECVCGQYEEKRNLFMVGDVKQSIYRFRLAEPRLFVERYDRYSKAGAEHDASAPGEKIHLSKNFRSSESIIRAVNQVFMHLMTGGPAELHYDSDAYLRHAKPGGAVPEAYLIDLDEEEEEDEHIGPQEHEELENPQVEARFVGLKILEMLGRLGDEPKTILDSETGQMRPVREGDFAVLLRATTGVAQVYWEELRALGLSAYAELASGYFDAVEVKVFMSLLAVIDNPRQDIPLAAVLRSPLVGLSAEEMMDVRLGSSGQYIDAVRNAAALGTPVGTKCKRFLEQLESWRTASRRMSVSQLMSRLLDETRYDLIAQASPDGNRRVANLNALLSRARQFDSNERPGLQRFLRYIERLAESGADLGSPGSWEDGSEVIRIMSIHKSKGLEFPVVFVSGIGRKFNRQDLSRDILYHREMGIGLLACDRRHRLKYPTLGHRAIAQRMVAESLAEEIRVLYVALTRAKDYLVITGAQAGLCGKIDRWKNGGLSGPLDHAALLAAGSYLDLIGPLLLSPEHIAGSFNVTVVGREHSRRFAPDTSLKEAAPALGALGAWLSPEARDELIRRIKWQYPYRALEAVSAKLAASQAWRLKGLSEGSGPLVRPEKRGDGGKHDAAAAGSAVHLVLQHLDLGGPLDASGIEAQIARIECDGFITSEQASMVDTQMIARFFDSPPGRLMVENRNAVEREVVFTVCVPAAEIYPELAGTPGAREGIVVQGVIDCLISLPTGLVIIDYKTDRLGPDGQEERANRYMPQIALYARAASSLRSSPVHLAYLCFLDAGVQVMATGDLLLVSS